jgi:hypothetical protein
MKLAVNLDLLKLAEKNLRVINPFEPTHHKHFPLLLEDGLVLGSLRPEQGAVRADNTLVELYRAWLLASASKLGLI